MCRISAWSYKFGTLQGKSALEPLLRHITKEQWELYWCTTAQKKLPLTIYRTGWSRLNHMPLPTSRRCLSPTKPICLTEWFPQSKDSNLQMNMASNSSKHQQKLVTILTRCSIKWQIRSFVIAQYKHRSIREGLTDLLPTKHRKYPESKHV